VSGDGYGARALGVVERRQIGAYTLLALADEREPEPGQFAMLATAERWGAGADERPFLPRAVSVCAHEPGRVEYLLEAVGPGTERLCSLDPGETVLSLGPLGHGFSQPLPGERALLVGGGIGVAPLVALERATQAATVLLGFRDAQRAAAAELFAAPRVATDDGSVGAHGSVLALLERELGAGGARVFACGPAAMLEAVRALCAARLVPCELALESPMACGYGACWGCVVPLADGGYARLCVDGPVLDGARLARVGEGFGAAA
jgi:NAD(P)H-flavin reductase